MEANETREMVLAAGAGIARKVIDGVEQTGLNGGHMDDTIEVLGIEWHLSVVFFTSSGFVQISGHPVPTESMQWHPFMAAFVDDRQDNGSFVINFPKDWLPDVTEAAAKLETTTATRG